MGDTIIITPQLLAIAGGVVGLLATISAAVARAFWKRLDQADERTEKRFEKLEALIKQSEERSEKRIDQSDERTEKRFEKLEARIGQSEERTEKRFDQSDERTEKRFDQADERTEKRFEKLEARFDQSDERTEKRFDQSDERTEKRFEKQDARSDKQEALGQKHHSEVQTDLRDLNSRVNKLESAGDAHDRSAGRSGPQSPRRDDDSAAAPEGESDPPKIAKHFDPSMVPLAGGRSEPQHSAGLARQAVPDEQQVGETDSALSEEESPDAPR